MRHSSHCNSEKLTTFWTPWPIRCCRTISYQRFFASFSLLDSKSNRSGYGPSTNHLPSVLLVSDDQNVIRR